MGKFILNTRNAISHGLDWPMVYGRFEPWDGWAVLSRESGFIIKFFPSERNINGFDFAEHKAYNYSAPEHDPAINYLQDMVA